MPKRNSAKARALLKIATEIQKCRICKKDKIGLPVPGEGNPDADLVFLGEAPGKTEAKTGKPFVGRSGKLLRQLIKAAGLKDEEIYITSPVKYLPKHITPTPAEITHGRKHLKKQLEVIKPKIIVLLGRTACFAMLEEFIPVAKVHGTFREKNGMKFLIAYHPAAPLYSPKLRGELKNDFKKLKRFLKSFN